MPGVLGAETARKPAVPETSFSHFWRQARYSESAFALWPEGTFEDPNTPDGRLLEPAGRVHFAGDHLSFGGAWQHGALESARMAVTKLHERVLAEG